MDSTMITRRNAYEALCSSLERFAADRRYSEIEIRAFDMGLGGGSQSCDPDYYFRFTKEYFPEETLPTREALLRSAAFLREEFIRKQSVHEFEAFVDLLIAAANGHEPSDPLLVNWLR